MTGTRKVHDPFLGKDVEVSNRLVDRLRGNYAMGPHLPNGAPEFGWRQFQAPPIQHEAAAEIERLRDALQAMVDTFKPFTMKPIGAPGSAARIEQQGRISVHASACFVLKRGARA
jgi:hypothetical protein